MADMKPATLFAALREVAERRLGSDRITGFEVDERRSRDDEPLLIVKLVHNDAGGLAVEDMSGVYAAMLELLSARSDPSLPVIDFIKADETKEYAA
jgi:hypothetical protein